MGRRGPVPAPDNVRQLRGSKPLRNPDGSRARRLVLAPRAPAPPPGLSQRAGSEWRRIAAELGRAGVLAEVDRGVLTAYCQAWGHMMEAEVELKKFKVVVTDKNGDIRKNPAWQVWREAQNAMIAAGRELYITPVSRLRIPVAPGSAGIGDDDGDDAFD